jgi:hypothetical protein
MASLNVAGGTVVSVRVPSAANQVWMQPQLVSTGSTGRVLFRAAAADPARGDNDGAMAHEELWSETVTPGQELRLKLVKASDYTDLAGGANDIVAFDYYTDVAGRRVGNLPTPLRPHNLPESGEGLP